MLLVNVIIKFDPAACYCVQFTGVILCLKLKMHIKVGES